MSFSWGMMSKACLASNSCQVISLDCTGPIAPCYKPPMDEDRLVHAMVPNALEEDSPTKQGDLKCIYINICAVVMPGVCSNCVGDEVREKPIEVQQKEQSAMPVISVIQPR